MAEYSYEELKKKTVAQLRDIAAGMDHESLKGQSVMHKDDLLKALCSVMGIDLIEHHHVVGIDKASTKARIKAMKAQRDAALAAGDHKQLKVIRRTIHNLKRRMHKATV